MVEELEQTAFKQTEVGEIPSDWEIKPIEELAIKVGSGKTPTGGERVYKTVGRPFVRSQNIGWGELLLEDIAFIDDQTHNSFSGTEIKENDVFLNITGASIGRSSIANHMLIGGNVNQHVCIIRLEIDKNEPQYLNHFLLSSAGQKQINDFQTGGNRQGLNFSQIKSILLPLPPTLAEQTVIATALTDADALITQLEKLIAKKKAIKQGAMQELLTGRQRINGFTDEWIEEPLLNVCWFQEGPGLRNWQFTSSGMKVINVTNLENGYLNLDKTDRYISMEEFNRVYKHFEIEERDIVIASSGNSYGKISVVRKQDLPLVMNTSVIRFKPLRDIDYYFLLAFLKSSFFKDQIDLLITGGAQPNFGPAHLKKVFIKAPKTKEEQACIGQILSDMDAEIEKLEQRLEKLRLLKQGMMQVLLTGRIRLLTT
ncbi:restriction endonuclease subunit S [Spirosoma migulaei]